MDDSITKNYDDCENTNRCSKLERLSDFYELEQKSMGLEKSLNGLNLEVDKLLTTIEFGKSNNIKDDCGKDIEKTQTNRIQLISNRIDSCESIIHCIRRNNTKLYNLFKKGE